MTDPKTLTHAETLAIWTCIRRLTNLARAYHVTMTTHPMPLRRDEATRHYVEACDALVAELGRLGEAGKLAEIGGFIAAQQPLRDISASAV